MMILYLTRKVGTEPVPLSLPATPADIGNTFAELDTICPDPSATEIYSGGKFSVMIFLMTAEVAGE